MSTATVASFGDIEDEFTAYLRDIRYATMVTVDAGGRPRARVLIAVWEVADGRPVGWLATYRTPVKTAHLAANPHTTFSYWSPRQNAVFIDADATWAEDEADRRRAWDLYRAGSPRGVGYDPAAYWRGGPADPQYHLLRLAVRRVQVVRGTDLRGRIWRAPR
ncbi:pyridoxamine 5'-phosphate oxidase family protein [Streptomyces litchfieldiae]|uniref:Pyridoxamine 5'-phosphate oxidase family protein n=1 Tax=Streptomyces litchfieldiae TaxID=3075543 RepID=A0ABU2MW94_9ACTN|nr:pyridoxamine 5'-phosphate oxidase family protein [Streptomyces sp. DSM 44938]MDT0345113.1 pyridoxamine 5'-phosphate oxidase family protein [Streptomyces sp. DSM 44938]